jgi:exodeoxyribonuclease VII small subunit
MTTGASRSGCPGDSSDASSGDYAAEPADNLPDFEAALELLESIVAELESGQLPLSRSVEQYERGVRILRQCHTALERVQQRIELLTRVNEDGTCESRPLNTDPGEGAGETLPGRQRKTGRPPRSDVDDEGRLF